MTATATHPNISGLEQVLQKYAEDFSISNQAAKVILRGMALVGIGIRPVLDHLIFRTLNPKERIQEFHEFGYTHDPSVHVIGHKKNPLEVYRCKCLPAILVEEAKDQECREWVQTFGDKTPYVMAVRVNDIEDATFRLEKQAVGFLRPGAGKKGEELREIAAFPVFENGKAASVLLLAERHAGNLNYYAPGFWGKA